MPTEEEISKQRLAVKVPALQDAITLLATAFSYDTLLICEDAGEAETVTIASRNHPSSLVFISVIGKRAGDFDVSYDLFRQNHDGRTSTLWKTSENVGVGGLRWIASKVFADGCVTGEWERVPAKRKR